MLLQIALLASAALALPQPEKRAFSAATFAGQSVSAAFPGPNAPTPNTALFPNEQAVGTADSGPTPTGVEPFIAQTATAYASITNNFPGVVQPQPAGGSSINILFQQGNLSPMHSVPSSQYGLPNASPLVPDSCSITQVHILYRHGARYPSGSNGPIAFAANLQAAVKNGSGFTASGPLSFLNTWQYTLGQEVLTPIGRSQEFELGLQMRMLYGHLLNNFTQTNTLPVFRTTSEDRMVKSALNFAGGFFGIPEYSEQMNLVLQLEAPNINNTLAPNFVCPNMDSPSISQAQDEGYMQFLQTWLPSTMKRVQGYMTGYNFTGNDILNMMSLCAYETVALGSSDFCGAFTESDWKNQEYLYDIEFYYEQGFGSPIGAALGKGWVEEFVARLTKTPITSSDSSVNITLQSSTYNPLGNSIYADATHEVFFNAILTALNLTAIAGSNPLPLTSIPSQQTYVAANVVPFSTRMAVQRMSCSNTAPTDQIRFVVNDAVVPINVPGCTSNANGLCATSSVVSGLQQRLSQIDFQYACKGNYNATVGSNTNGLPPKQ